MRLSEWSQRIGPEWAGISHAIGAESIAEEKYRGDVGAVGCSGSGYRSPGCSGRAYESVGFRICRGPGARSTSTSSKSKL